MIYTWEWRKRINDKGQMSVGHTQEGTARLAMAWPLGSGTQLGAMAREWIWCYLVGWFGIKCGLVSSVVW